MNAYMQDGVHCCISECLLSWDVACLLVFVFEHVPLVVFSAHGERSGLSGPTLLRSTSETRILSERKRQTEGERGQRGWGGGDWYKRSVN